MVRAARRHGFDLHAGIVVPAGHRDRLERLCRYALRPPVGQDRLQLMPDGTAVLELRRRWTDGTTHLVFEPVKLLERLAALTPRPRINLILYHGVTDQKGIETVPFYFGPSPRLSVLYFVTTHTYEHYGNLVTYMRLKNIVPPSSEPAKPGQ